MRPFVLVPAALLLLAGCAREEKSAAPAPPPAETAAVPAEPAGPAKLTNRVWRVVASNVVEPGSLRAFLAESTLVMSDPHATPALGAWHEEPGVLVLVEEGRPYTYDVLASSPETLRVKGRGPGEPVEMTLVPAAE